MLKCLLLLVFLVCHQACVCTRRGDLTWQDWLLVDPDSSRPVQEEEDPPKTRRITPKSVFIAPAFSGSSPLPDCAEGYKADSMGRCVKLVQLNHAAQLNFLLQRLNAMYATRPAEREYADLKPSDSNSGPLHVTIPLEIPREPPEETKESVEVAVVMADVLKGDKKPEAETIVAVWNVGKNGTELEEVEAASDLQMQDKNSNATGDNNKYDVISDGDNNATTSHVSEEKPSNESVAEPARGSDSAMGLLEQVSAISSEDGRSGNTSRRNVSSATEIKNENGYEKAAPSSPMTGYIVKKTDEPLRSAPVDSGGTRMKQTTTTARPGAFVRFPSEDGPYHDSPYPYNRYARPNYVQFPQDFYADPNPGPMLPSDVHQRPSYWWLPPGWRLDPSRHQPVLIRFWARMPLLRDPMYQHSMADHTYEDANMVRRRRPLVF